MHRKELADSARCHLCGEVLLAQDDLYTAVDGRVVCHECATRHHGVYDAATETWKVPPKLPASQSKPGPKSAR
jgi:hypothetical protein